MFTNIAITFALAGAILAGSGEPIYQPTCCMKKAYCCSVERDCCRNNVTTDSSA